MTAEELLTLLADLRRRFPAIQGRPVYRGLFTLTIDPEGQGTLSAAVKSRASNRVSQMLALFGSLAELEEILRGKEPDWHFPGDDY